MAVIINGDTGIDKITDGSVVGADIASTFDLTGKTVTLPTSIPLGVRNLIINGDMRIDQRNAGASVTPSTGTYTLDRYRAYQNATGKFTVQQSSTAPDGFENSVQITSTSAHTVASGELFVFMQYIEGYNVAHLDYGTSNAQTITISFWVRSSLTGTFGGALLNQAENRNYPFTYDISSADTWEQKSITIAGDTTGTWLKTNGVGLQVNFSLGMGSTYSGTAGAWASGAKFSATGATSVVSTSGATWYMTGLQVEKGDTATPFEHRPYDMELARCQRYLPVIGKTDGASYLALNASATATTHGTATFEFPVQARTRPTGLELTASVGSYYLDDFSSGHACSAISVLSSSNNGATIRGTTTGLTQYRPLYFWFAGGKILFTGCEL